MAFMRRILPSALLALLPGLAAAQSFPAGCWLPDPGPDVPELVLLLSDETAVLDAAEGPCTKGEDLWTCTLPCGTLDLTRRNDVTLDIEGNACVPALHLHSRAPEACTP